MSLLLSWRRFGFFDREQVMEAGGEPFMGLEKMETVGVAAGGTHVVLGEREGGVTLLERSMSMIYWKAHKHQLRHLAYVRHHNILFTIGEDSPGDPELKAWHLGRMEKDGRPFCSRVSRVQLPGGRRAQITALAVHSSLHFLALGFDDSSVVLYRGEATREKATGKPQLVRDGLSSASDGAVLGLSFRMLKNGRLVLFTVTSHAVLALVLREKELERTNILDSKGADGGAWTVTDRDLEHQLVVGRRDMVFFYHPTAAASAEEGGGLAGKCYGFDGDKILVRSAGPYLAIVSRDVSNLQSATPMHTLTLYDIPEQYIAFSGPMPEVQEIFYEWGAFFVLCRNGKLFRLVEKDIREKLDILHRKNLFDLSTALAKRSGSDKEELGTIFKRHGDYLYAKGDFDNAVREYIQTLGVLQPSYVIKKFLEAQRIEQLTKYLEALHKAGLGSPEHTSILLNCYTKLGSAGKIAAFLKDAGAEMPFDLDTAVRVLAKAHYYEEALQLSRERQRPDLVMHILLEHQSRSSEALAELRAMPVKEATAFIKRYGPGLAAYEPAGLQSLLSELCSKGAEPAAFLNVFLAQEALMKDFLEGLDRMQLKEASGVGDTMLELYLREWQAKGKTPEAEERVLAFLREPSSPYQEEQGLVLCQDADFVPGQLYLYERLGLHEQILGVHMAKKDFASVMVTCKRFGGEEGERMWVQALWFLAKSEDPRAVDWVRECLEQLDKLNLLPPLMVLEILSHSQALTLGVVKDYLLSWLSEEDRRIKEDEAATKAAQEKIAKLDELIWELENRPTTFQVSKCSACGSGLEVPAVHFLCKHSYHLSCFQGYAETESECPMCAPRNAEILAAAAGVGGGSGGKEAFAALKSDLAASKDSIATVAEHFGKGVFGASVAAPAPAKQPLPRKKSLNPFDEED